MGSPAVTELGYIEIGASNLEAWHRYAEEVLNVECTLQDNRLRLRYDDDNWRITLIDAACDDILCAGFRLASYDDLLNLGNRLGESGVEVTPATQAQLNDRGVEAMLVCHDPDGLTIELFTGERKTAESFIAKKPRSGFVTEDLGMGHVAITTGDEEATLHFYEELLGFQLSDHIDLKPPREGPPGGQIRLTFLHCNPRHHTLAIVPVPAPKRLHHLMLQARSFDDVGLALDAARAQRIALSASLGKHTNDQMVSFYMRSPSGFDIEYGFGGITIDDASWQTTSYDATSLWGHDHTT